MGKTSNVKIVGAVRIDCEIRPETRPAVGTDGAEVAPLARRRMQGSEALQHRHEDSSNEIYLKCGWNLGTAKLMATLAIIITLWLLGMPPAAIIGVMYQIIPFIHGLRPNRNGASAPPSTKSG